MFDSDLERAEGSVVRRRTFLLTSASALAGAITGVHAAAIIKAQKKGDRWLTDYVYSGVPASLIGRNQEIEIGPMSGSSNVIFYLSQRGIVASHELIQAVLLAAKESNRILQEPQILSIVQRFENVTS